MSHFGTEWLYDGYARYLQDLTVIDTNGKTLQIKEIGKTQWIVEAEDESPVTLHYKVLLHHDEREWPFGRNEAPYAPRRLRILARVCTLFIVGEVKVYSTKSQRAGQLARLNTLEADCVG